MGFLRISLLSNVRGLIRRAPSSRRLYVVPALSRRTNPPTVSHSEKQGKELELNKIGVLRDDPYLALSFLNRIEGNGAQPSVHAFAILIRNVCSCGLNKKLGRLLVELIRKGDEGRGFSVEDLLEAIVEAEEEDGEKGEGSSQMLRKLCDSLAKAYANLKMFDKAVDAYFELKCTPDVKALNFLMKRMVACGENEMALSAFLHFRLGVDKDKDTYVLLVQAYRKVVCCLCNEMETDAAERLVLQMEKLGIAPDVFVYLEIIQGHRRNLDFCKALVFFRDIVAPRRNKINRVIASSILQCFCQMGQLSEAYDLFKEFRKKKVTLDRVCYNVACDALVKLGQVEEAIKLFREMTGKGIAPDVVNYTTLINGCCQQGKFQEALDLMIEMDGTVKAPDTVIYDVLARGLARNKHAKEALGTLKLMEARGLKPTPVTHSILLEGLIVGGNADKAESLYESLGDEKTRENELSMVKGYAEAGLPDQAYERFGRLDFPLPKNVYITLFSSLCAGDKACAGDKDRAGKAQDLLERMPEVVGVEPGKRMYGKLIRAWCRVKEVRKAMKNFKVLLSCKKIVPDLCTYTSMIKAYCWKEDFKDAYDLFQEMKQMRIVPDVVTYTVLLNNIPELDMKREMKALGIERDVHYYTVMIDQQCKTGELQDAERIFDEMIENGLEPDAAPYTALIARCCRDGDVCKASKLMKEMREMGIEPTQDIIDKIEYTKSKGQFSSTLVHDE